MKNTTLTQFSPKSVRRNKKSVRWDRWDAWKSRLGQLQLFEFSRSDESRSGEVGVGHLQPSLMGIGTPADNSFLHAFPV